MTNKLTNIFLILTILAVNVGTASAQQKHESVDLGLPSGTMWATCNVGAANPWEYGDFFAWGETTTKKTYSDENYKYCKGDMWNLTKYCPDLGNGYNEFKDNLTVLVSADDAATAKWGAEWCTPTIEQWEELIDNCTWTWNDQEGKKGYEIKGKNGNSIFLPPAALVEVPEDADEDYVDPNADDGWYWSSSLCVDNPYAAWHLNIAPGFHSKRTQERYSPLPIRPIKVKK